MSLKAFPICVVLVAMACYMAYDTRMYAIREYGTIIHELDPWFNYRAAEYLASQGSERFFKWFDYMSWYPLGRPVGTTIYPGMQFASVTIWKLLNSFGIDISVNDTCAYTPVWFGIVATIILGLLAWEASGKMTAGAIAAVVMAIVPAHLMRSVGGGYDNECVAVTFLVSTFYLWIRSLRTAGSWWIGVLAGLSYFCMAATWGGFIFVTNMVALHALAEAARMFFTDQYCSRLHRSFSLYFLIGTSLSMRIPVIDKTPIKSLEQLLALFVFILLQVLEACEWQRRAIEKDKAITPRELRNIRVRTFGVVAGAALLVIAALWPTGYFGPLSSRVRGLLVPHTRTGNPLVDSVSEHQPASPQAYYQMLHFCCFFAPAGLVLSMFAAYSSSRRSANLFLVLWAGITYHFSSKMNRLLLLMGPVTAALTGIAIDSAIAWSVRQISGVMQPAEDEPKAEPSKAKDSKAAGKKKQKPSSADSVDRIFGPLIKLYQENPLGRAVIAGVLLVFILFCASGFYEYAHNYAQGMSNPQIIYTAYDHSGRKVVVRDYVDAYHWLRDNTPQDARVIAWWDYGYQITGIGNRTSIADGNTWNHEHIATLGRCLTSPVARAHEKCVRHIADYVLVWAGGGHDDLSKSPHMARIGNSVYSDICPGDPLCQKFGFKPPTDPSRHYTEGEPTPMMAKSLLYQVIASGHRPGVNIDPSLFQEVYTSTYRKVRIFKVMNISQESKEWIADPSNRNCDAPGSWYCPGNYPPAMQDWLKNKKAFRQLEDFNRGADEDSDEYHKSYMSKMGSHAA
eukprot:Hpha_TRINITY_DN14869_c3_g5::TRINITY_DN14869_c3_g5_i1::g.169565::m.169565/K07151/STT3; dolichyl-diphosphooligosaccharide--protein glycosyltransferase